MSKCDKCSEVETCEIMSHLHTEAHTRGAEITIEACKAFRVPSERKFYHESVIDRFKRRTEKHG